MCDIKTLSLVLALHVFNSLFFCWLFSQFNQYRNLEEVAADLNLVFDNARQYNADDSLLYQVLPRKKPSSFYLPIHYSIRAILVKIVREGWNADLFFWVGGSPCIFFSTDRGSKTHP